MVCSASISLPAGGLDPGLASPICVVSTLQVLSPAGWLDLANITRDSQPFQLYSDSGNTFLQWLGDSAAQQAVEGRLVLVHLLCKHTGRTARRLFSPCIAFRVAGSPGSYPIARINCLAASFQLNDIDFDHQLRNRLPSVSFYRTPQPPVVSCYCLHVIRWVEPSAA